jgi:hypothetical protein
MSQGGSGRRACDIVDELTHVLRERVLSIGGPDAGKSCLLQHRPRDGLIPREEHGTVLVSSGGVEVVLSVRCQLHSGARFAGRPRSQAHRLPGRSQISSRVEIGVGRAGCYDDRGMCLSCRRVEHGDHARHRERGGCSWEGRLLCPYGSLTITGDPHVVHQGSSAASGHHSDVGTG